MCICIFVFEFISINDDLVASNISTLFLIIIVSLIKSTNLASVPPFHYLSKSDYDLINSQWVSLLVPPLHPIRIQILRPIIK